MVYGQLQIGSQYRYGGCSEWRNRLSAASVALQSSQYAVSTTLVRWSISDMAPSSFVCSGANVTNIVNRLISSTGSDSSSVQCDGHMWKVSKCTGDITSVCVDCLDPCTAECSSETIVAPCGTAAIRCPSTFGVSSLLGITMKELQPAPDANITFVDPTLTDVSLEIWVEYDATVQIGIFEAGTVVQSTTAITLQNRQYRSQSNKVVMSLTGLTPATDYDVYLLTRSFMGSVMTLANVLKSKTTFSTFCCRNLTISLNSLSVIQGRDSLYTISVSMAKLPTRNITLTIQLVHTATGSVTSAFPSSVIFSSQQSATSLNSALSISSSSTQITGQLKLSAVISGYDRKGYVINYAASRHINIISAHQQPAPPILKSSQFSNDGTLLMVLFDSPTNMGGSLGSVFACSLMFEFTGSSATSCRWQNSQLVFVYLGGSASVVVDDKFGLRTSVIKASCPVDTNCSTWGYSPTSTTRILAPSIALVPVVSIASPQLLSICSSLTIDISGSSGSAGRSWTNATFGVISASSSSTSAVQCAANVAQFLNSRHYVLSPPTAIPSSLLNAGSYSISVTLCNFLGGCGQSSVVVVIVNKLIPLVVIQSVSFQTIKRSFALRLPSNAYLPTCNSSIVSRKSLQSSWSVFVNGVQTLSLQSTSKQSGTFLVPSYTLQTTSLYTFVVSVFDQSSLSSSSAQVQVYVEQSALVAIVTGGLMRSIAFNVTSTVDASGSYDQDKLGVTGLAAGLSFMWSCVTLTPALSDVCALDVVGSVVSPTLGIFAGASAINSTCSFSVTVYDKSRSAVQSVTISVVGADVPIVAISSNAVGSKLNPSDKLSLTAKVQISMSSKCQWAVDDSSLVLSSSALTDVSQTFLTSSARTFSTNLVLNSNVLGPRVTYTFSLSCTVVGTRILSTSAIAVVTNGPPLPGVFSITPLRGAEMVDPFLLSALLWTDPDLPITFGFGFQSVAGVTQSLQLQSQLSFTSSYLSAGSNALNYTLTCICQIYDAFNSNTSVTAQVQVTPYQGSTEDLSTLLASNVAAQLSSGSSEDVRSAVSTAGAILNSVSCLLAPNCTNLNRLACSTTADTCGSCVSSQYLGDDGDSNGPCVSVEFAKRIRRSSVVASASSCAQDVDCGLWQQCHDRVCSSLSKNCTGSCFAKGRCTFVNSYSGQPLDTCLEGDPSCEAMCICSPGYNGADCSLTTAALISKQKVRLLLIEVLHNLTITDDITNQNLEAWMSGLVSLAQSAVELTPSSLSIIHNIGAKICASAASLESSYESILPVMDVVNSLANVAKLAITDELVLGQVSRSLVTSNQQHQSSVIAIGSIKDLLSQFAETVFPSMFAGQPDIVILKSMLSCRLSTTQMVVGQEMVNLTSPQTTLESFAKTKQSSISVRGPSISSSTLNVMVAQLHAVGYGSFSDQLISNPMLVKVGNNTACSGEAAGMCGLTAVLTNNEVEDFVTDTEPVVRMVDCEHNIVHNYSVSCPLGKNVTAFCNGSFVGRITITCPYELTFPVCSHIEGESMHGCRSNNFDSDQTTCGCNGDSDNGDTSLSTQYSSIPMDSFTNSLTNRRYLAGSFKADNIEFELVELLSMVSSWRSSTGIVFSGHDSRNQSPGDLSALEIFLK